MKKINCITLLFIIFLSVSKAEAQTPLLDSLKLEFKKAKSDSLRCYFLYLLAENEYDINVWPVYNRQLGELALKNYRTVTLKAKPFFLSFYATFLSNCGYYNMSISDFNKALGFYEKALSIQKTLKDSSGLATTYSNMGYSLRQKGNVIKALDYYYRAMKLQELLIDKANIAVSFNNIGFVHGLQGEYEKALSCYRKAEKIHTELNEKDGLATCYGNMAKIFYTYGDIENKRGNINSHAEGVKKGIIYLNKSIRILTEIKDLSKLAGSMNALGGVYETKGYLICNTESRNCMEHNRKKASALYLSALKIREQIQDSFGLAQSYHSLAESFILQKKPEVALAYALKSFEIGKRLKLPERIRDASGLLKNIYKEKGKYHDAFEMYQIHNKMKDSLSNEQIKKADIKKQFEAEYEIQATKDSINNVAKIREQQFKHEQAITHQRIYTYGSYIGVALMLVVAGVSFKAFRNKQRDNLLIEIQKAEVERQKELIEEKQKEIVDSINYAKRIQQAHLPSQNYISRKLKELNP